MKAHPLTGRVFWLCSSARVGVWLKMDTRWSLSLNQQCPVQLVLQTVAQCCHRLISLAGCREGAEPGCREHACSSTIRHPQLNQFCQCVGWIFVACACCKWVRCGPDRCTPSTSNGNRQQGKGIHALTYLVGLWESKVQIEFNQLHTLFWFRRPHNLWSG